MKFIFLILRSLTDVLLQIQLHMAYLSSLMLLLIPVLIVFARKNASLSEIQNPDGKPAAMARLALDTAVIQSKFASVRADEGIFLSRSWLDV